MTNSKLSFLECKLHCKDHSICDSIRKGTNYISAGGNTNYVLFLKQKIA